MLDLSAAVAGRDAGAAADADAVELVRGHVEPEGDIHATADYRRMLVAELTLRALAAASAARAVEGAA